MDLEISKFHTFSKKIVRLDQRFIRTVCAGLNHHYSTKIFHNISKNTGFFLAHLFIPDTGLGIILSTPVPVACPA